MGASRVVVVGQGYVGLALAMRAVEAGFDVIGYDVDGDRIKSLAAGSSFVEDVSDAALQAALDTGRYRPVVSFEDVDGFDVAVIAVPTPLREGAPDLSYIETAARSLAGLLHAGATVVLESTTYPGTTEELVAPILERGSGLAAGIDFHLGYSPERIDPGNRTHTLVTTPKVVSGIDAASTKPFGYVRFSPGPGVGGHCLPVDPSYLSWQVRRRLGQSFRFVELANDVNDGMPDYVVRRVTVALNRQGRAVLGSRILLLGVSFKRNVGDCREAPSRRIARLLSDLGADLRATDPHVVLGEFPPGTNPVELTPDELAGADAVVALVDHDAFDPGMVVEHARYVLDTRGWLPIGDNVERL